MLQAVQHFGLQYIQILHHVLADVEGAGASISGEKFDLYGKELHIVAIARRDAGRRPELSKRDKLWDSRWGENHTSPNRQLGYCLMEISQPV